MKIKELIKREAINWFLILMPFIYIFLVYDKLPQFAPIQIDKDQRIYQVILFIMGVSIVTYIRFLIKPFIVPKTAFHENLKSFHRMKTLLLAYTSLLSMGFISEKIGIVFNWSKSTFVLAFIFMMAIGNLYPTLRFNYFIGIKNPWTRSNELIWKKTHQFAGRIFFFGGFIGVLYGIFFNVHPVPYMPVILVGYVFVLLFVPKFYSYLLYRQFQSQNSDR